MSGRRRAEPAVIAEHGDLLVESDPRRPSGRLLRQGDMEASYVDLSDPRYLEFEYLRRMRDLVQATRARRIVHVGAAGCALARALAAGPGGRDLRQEAVDVDAGVLDVARRHLGLRRLPGLRVRHGDGRALLAARRAASIDAVLIDAFVGARVPRHLVTAGALEDVARVLAPRGVVAINVVDVPPLADVRAIGAGLLERFAVVAALGAGPVLRARRGGNVVLVAGQRTLPLERLREKAAADPSPAALLGPGKVAALCSGVTPWSDSER